jgi:hypothetical protein
LETAEPTSGLFLIAEIRNAVMVWAMSTRPRVHAAPRPSAPPQPSARTYTLLVFDDLLPAPWAIIVGAEDDAKAIEVARSIHPLKRRELWSGQRLVSTSASWIS